ncbi:MAG: hypothetical protein ABL993_04540 [Vicinamibacterales bacterium]
MTSQRVRTACAAFAVVLGALIGANAAYAQSQGRVAQDDVTIWRLNESVVATTVDAGTILDVTAQSDRWYQVVIPRNLGGRGEQGLIAITQVQLLPGSPVPPVRALRGSATAEQPQQRLPVPRAAQAPGSGSTQRPTRRGEPMVGVRGFGQAAYVFLNARESFKVVLGKARGPSFGGGAQLRIRNGVFAQASWERFRETGQRVFVFEDSVFPLGVPNTITITPITVTGGLRFSRDGSTTPYVGGGITSYHLTETSPFTDESEKVDARYMGYQALGGLEFRTAAWMSTAAEIQYTSVGNALGASGVSQFYNEHNLGGVQVQVKVLIGR